MNGQTYPVTVAVKRPDGSIEHVRVGSAEKRGDGFVLRLGDLAIGAPGPGAMLEPPPRSVSAAPPPSSAGGLVFPPYGRSKGAPIAGASVGDLEFYASGCRRTLADPAKSRWHDKERQLLAAIEGELARQGGGGGGGGGGFGAGGGSPRAGGGPPRDDDDVPPMSDDDLRF